MTTDVLETHLVAYLSLREALGFQMHAENGSFPRSWRMSTPKSPVVRSEPRWLWSGPARPLRTEARAVPPDA